jgi:hypothetical protein
MSGEEINQKGSGGREEDSGEKEGVGNLKYECGRVELNRCGIYQL